MEAVNPAAGNVRVQLYRFMGITGRDARDVGGIRQLLDEIQVYAGLRLPELHSVRSNERLAATIEANPGERLHFTGRIVEESRGGSDWGGIPA